MVEPLCKRGEREDARSALCDFIRRMEIRDLRTVTGETIDRYRGRLFLDGLSESTRQMRGQSAPRKLFRWLVRLGHVPADPTKDLEPMRVRHMERIPVLTRAEVARLIFRCPPAPDPRKGRREPIAFFRLRFELHNLVELRDRALLALVYDIPLRGGEPSLLERNHYDEIRGEISTVGAKRQSEPVTFPVHESTKAAMALYLEALGARATPNTPPFFRRSVSGGRIRKDRPRGSDTSRSTESSRGASRVRG